MGEPTVSFDNVGLNLGSFLSSLLAPVLTDIQSVTSHLQPVLNVLNARLPVLSDLSHLIGEGDVNLIGLAKLVAPFAGLGPLADLIAQLDTIITDIDTVTVSAGNIAIPLGGFNLNNYDLRTTASAGDPSNLSLTSLTNLSIDGGNIQIAQAFSDFVSGLNVPQGAKDALTSLTSGLTNGVDLEFPILNNPSQAVFNMLLGKDSDLFTLAANMHLDAQENTRDFSVVGMGLGFGGDIKVDAKFTFAYDTYGLREMINQIAAGTFDAGQVASDIADGFYVADDSYLSISGSIGASAGVTVGFFGVSVNGGITTGNDGQDPVSITINDPDHDGKLRFSEIPSNPLGAFNTSGELDAGLFVEVKVGMDTPLGFVGYKQDFDIAHVVIFSFNPQAPPPVTLASQADASGNVTLYIGSRAGQRSGVDQTDGGENYTIRHVGDDSDGETIEIDAFNASQTIHHVKSISGLGDLGDLTVNVEQGVESSVNLHGGQGRADLTYSGSGQAYLTAGQLDSILTGGSGSNFLFGGAGNDTITTGPGINLIGDTQGDNAVIVAGPFASLTFSGGSPGYNTLEVVPQKTTTAVSVTPSFGFLQLRIDDSSAPESSADLMYFSQLLVDAHGRSMSISVGDLSGVGINQETIDVANGLGSRAIDLETRADGAPSSLAMSALTQTYPDAKNPAITITEQGVAVVDYSTGLTTNVFGMSSDDTLTIHQHGGTASIADLGGANGAVILDTTGPREGLGEVVTLTTPVQAAGATIATDGYGIFGAGGFRIRAAGDPDIVVAGLQVSDSVTIDVSSPALGSTNQVSLDASALVGALHLAAIGSFVYDNMEVSSVGAQATVDIDGGAATTSVTVGAGQLGPIEGVVNVSNAILKIDNSTGKFPHILTMTGTTFSGWNIPIIGPSMVTYAGLYSGLIVNVAPGDRLDIEQTPAGVNATFNDLSSTRDDAYIAGASSPLTFNGDFALTFGERLLSDGSVTPTNDLQGLANLPVTFNLSQAQNDPSSVAFLNPAAQSYTIGGNGNFVVADQTVGLTVTVNGFGSQDAVLLDLPGGSVDADLTQTSLGNIRVDGSSRDASSTAANAIAVTTNAANVSMQPDTTVPQTFRITPTNEPVFLVAGILPQDELTVNLSAPQANLVEIDASLIVGALNIKALGGASNQDNITLAEVGPQAAVTIDGGAANANVALAAGQLASIEHDVTVSNVHLTINNSIASIASILTLTDSMFSGWAVPNTNLTPVLHVGSLDDLTIDAAAGDRFDLEGKLPVTINNAWATRDAVYDMATGGVLNGDFSLDMGWRLLHDGTITKPETLQGLNAVLTVNFSSASSAATQVVFDGNLDPAGAAYTIGNDQLGNLLFVNQTVGLSVEINGYRGQDQVWVDLPGGSVTADLTHTGPGTIYLDGSVRLSGTNSTAANQIAVHDRAGAVTMQADGANNNIVQMFNTLYLLGSMPQDSLALTQPTDFKVTPSDALYSQKPFSAIYIDAFGSARDAQGNPIYKLGVGTLVTPPPAGFVVFLSSPAILDPAAPYTYFTDFTNGYEGWSTPAPSPVNVTPPIDVGYAGVDYQDTVITYASIVGTVTIPVRVFAISSHPVPIDNSVNLDASQLRGTFSYSAADPDYDTLRQIIGNVFGEASFAFGKTTVNLTAVNPQLSVAITGQDPPVNSQGGLVFQAAELADNRIPTTSVNVGQGLLANIQGNVTVQLAQLTVDDGRGSLAGILTLTDTSLTGWATALGTTQPTLFFATYMHDDLATKMAQARDPFSTLSEALLEYPDVLFNLHDDFVITGSPVDQFDVENTPTTGSALGAYSPASANQTLIQNLATSGAPANVFVIGKALPRLHVLGNFALTIGQQVRPDGTVDDVGSTERVFYVDYGVTSPVHSMAITYDFTGVGQGPLVVDDSNDNLVNGVVSNYDGIVTGVFANTDYPGHGYLRSCSDPQNAFDGDIVIYGPYTAVSYYSTQYYRHSVQINNTIAATMRYVVNAANDIYGETQIYIGAATGPVEVLGNGANTFVTIDPTTYKINGVASTSLSDTITADVTVSNATLQIVADAAGASPPANPPNVVLSADELIGVATGTIHFHDLVNSQDGIKEGLAGFALSVQLPRGSNVSTVIQDTPAGIITEITTAAGATSGPVLVSGATGTLWLGRTLNYEFAYSYYSDPAKYDTNFVEAPFSAASVTIGTGSLQGVTGPVFLDYSAATPTTIDDHADAAGSQADLSVGPTPLFNNNTSVEFYPYELNMRNPIYFGYAFLAAPPAALTVLGAALTQFTVTASPLGTRLFAGAGSTVEVTAGYSADTVPALDILGAATVGVSMQQIHVGAPIEVEADPARPLDPTDLTVTSNLYLPISIGGAGNGFDSIAVTYNGASAQLIDYQADTTHLTFQDDGYYSHAITVTDTGAAGTAIVADYYGENVPVYVQGTTGPLQITGDPATQIVLGNAGSLQALRGEIDLLASSSAQPLLVPLDDSADTAPRTVYISVDEGGNSVISGLAPAAVRLVGVQADITSGTGGDSYQLLNVPAAILTITGNGVSDSLHGTAAGPNIWQFTGPASGILDGTVVYTGIPNPTFVAVPVAPGNQTSFNQQTIDLPIQTSGGDGQALSFAATGLPNGLGIDSLTGVISGKIQVSQAATYTVGVDVADGVNVASAQFFWTVTIDATPPTVSIAVSVNGAQPTFSATASDNLGGSGLASVQFQYSADGGATWIDAGPAETAAPFSYTLLTGLTNGTYLDRAIATDNVGNRAISAPSLATLVSLQNAYPYSGLVMDGSGNLYGTASYGGANSDGTVFELNPSTGVVTTLATFDGTNGAYPYSSLIMDGSGNLYGTTSEGGANSDGTVFELNPGTGLLTTLATFAGANGAYPYSSLVMDSSGNLYGTTQGNFTDNQGTVFELNRTTGVLSTLATFDGTNGASPSAGLILEGGNLYGTASYGGANSEGTLFEVNLGTGVLTILYSFAGPDGAYPYSGLIPDGSGNLYGTTAQGGANSQGTVFELNPATGALRTLASFDGANGAYPYAGLVMDSSGNLYGTASEGGANANSFGTVFEFNSSTGALSSLAAFDGTNGAYPYSALIIDSSGNLFGTASQRGANNGGTVVELSPATFTIKATTPTLVSIGPVSPSPRNVDLASDDVTFSEPIDLTNFDYGAISLSLNGGANLINSGVTISLVSGTTATYRIAGLDTLTTGDGTYILSVDVSHVRDLAGEYGTGTTSVNWLMDATPPTGSSVAPLAQRASSLTFAVTVNPGADPVSGGVASGIVSYDIYAASAPAGSSSLGAFSLWTTVPASNLTATFTAQSNTTYAFHSVAHDAAGNIEAKGANVIEASTYVPDLTPPVTQINSDAANAAGTFTLAFSGTSPGGSGIETFDLAVQVDGGPALQIGTLPGGTPVAGVYSGQTKYQGLADGLSHSYAFSIQGINGNGVAETMHSAPSVTDTFAVPAAPQATIFVVEKGLSERSYIRYLDVTFNEPVSSLTLDTAHVRLAHYGLDGVTLINAVDLTNRIALVDHVMEIDFGPGGIGGNENLPALLADWTKLILDDGYYKLTIDPDGTGLHDVEEDFYRLFGDVTGNATGGATTTGSSSGGDLIGQVSKADVAAVTSAVGQVANAQTPLLNADINGAGTVTSNDRLLTAKSVGRHLASGLHLDD